MVFSNRLCSAPKEARRSFTAEIAASNAAILAVLAEAVPVIRVALAPPDATAEKAAATKVEKQEEIKKLEVECTALDGVSTKANNLASKLEALFE